MRKKKPYFLGFAETCLKNCIKEAEIEIKGYSHETSNRINRDGGGVIVYVRNDLTYQTLISTSDEMCSMVSIHINELNLIVFMVYRPPPNNKNQYHGETLIRSFDEIVIKNIHKVMNGYKSPTPDIILTGDFNFPNASWNAGIGSVKNDVECNKSSLQQLINIASDLNLLQKVTEGTRKTRSGNYNMLELIFTNNHELISNMYIQPTKITDHEYIICETSHVFQSNDKQELNEELNLSTYNYETADWKSIKLRLKNINWSEILENYKISEKKMNKILEVVIKIVEENCLKFKYRRGALINKIPRDRRILLRKRKKIRAKLESKVASSSRKSVIKKSMGEIDNKLLLSHENEKNDMEKRAIENIKSNPKHFFAYARKKLKTRSKIGPFRLNQEIFNTLDDICKKLSEQYSSTFSSPDPNYRIENSQKKFSTEEVGPQLNDICFTRNSFVEVIKEVKNNAAPGTDHFPAVLLKKCAQELS